MAENRGFVIWFTGLSGAGKSTLTEMLAPLLRERGHQVEILDGDIVRTNLSKGLGFSKEDRDTNILRIGFVANLLARNGVVVITAAISPYREIRDQNRALVEGDGSPFIEVHAAATVAECEARDVKGLYADARAGKIKGFTGIDDPYEPPHSPEVLLQTGRDSVERSLGELMSYLESRGLIASAAIAR
ncbi:MAG: adenylyl-sulfate kinase [Dehalococcoidia bacterium]|nr:adenylyl-sulfate kinase [Dehalococcoidia bacterium]MCA9825843.1 adenylyl-sulfate kinase [Dehalococcoidia bacterium]